MLRFMSYEEFLNLPVDYIHRFTEIVEFKLEHNIPFSDEEILLQDHFIRYIDEIKLQEKRSFLEFCYDMGTDDKEDEETN